MAIFPWRHFHKEKLAPTKQLRFLQILERMLSKGLTISEALDTLTYYHDFKDTALRLKNDLKNGLHLDESLENCSFHPSLVTHLYVVRDNGSLENRIEQSVELFQNRLHYQKRFQQTVRYPLILIISFSMILFFVYEQVLPSFQHLFIAELPPFVRLTFSLLHWFGLFFLLLVVMIFCLYIFWSIYQKRIPIEAKLRIYTKIPLLATYYRKQTSFHFATQLSSLLQVGMSFHTLLSYMANQEKLPIVTYYAKLMQLQLAKGQSVESLLTSFSFIEKQLKSIMSTRVDATTLAKDLQVYAELSMEEMYHRFNKMITYIQPIFFLIMGGFIIFIYISLLTPMFEIINTM